MTLAEVQEIAGQRLAEYEPRLNVKGTRPYDALAVSVHRVCERNVLRKEDVQSMIDDVMDELAKQEDGFWMSEPRPNHDTPVGSHRATVAHNNLNLTACFGWSHEADTFRVQVWCWYYPA